MTHLTSERLTMRPPVIADFDDMCLMWCNPAFTQSVGVPAMSEETVWLRLLRDIGHWQVFGYGSWMAHVSDGNYAGSVGLLHYHRDLEPAFTAPEVGWGFRTEYQGQGLAREAAKAMLCHADTGLKLTRTVCMIGRDNHTSIRMAEALGYRLYAEGVYKGADRLNLYERAPA